MTEKAKLATELFPGNQDFIGLYRQIAIGQAAVNSAASYSTKGLEFFNSANYKNAVINFERAIELNPLEYSYFENAATANYLAGNLDKAIEQIDIVINEMNPLNGKCEYIKALIYIRLGDPMGACPLLQTSIDSGFAQAQGTYNQYCKQ